MLSVNLVRKIRADKEIEFEGMILRLIPGKEYGNDLEVGDTYLAQRNSGPKLLTVKEVHMKPEARYTNWVVPVEKDAYSFDLHECVGVEIVEKES